MSGDKRVLEQAWKGLEEAVVKHHPEKALLFSFEEQSFPEDCPVS